ncbi:MAG TPA: V-type ATP synthase subunit D [Acholeplasmataceae bacterium]|nr:V-type ATP synthase subunit D [Acholeplasmataceae bacterium]HQC30263.1 V-type ATP synthase subunit D [Acholeplasmataceae bacterium]
MAQKQVAATRMELTKLQNQLRIAKRGHKLLKDKQDEMVRQFMDIIRQNRELRIEVERELVLIMQKFNNAKNKSSTATINEALYIPTRNLELETKVNYIMNIETPHLEFEVTDSIDITYSFFSTPLEIDESLINLSSLLPKIIKLAELDKASSMLASEIEKTRRRVNAIEFVMMPEMSEQIHVIKMKLEDNERSNIVRLMKSKEIILNKETKEGKK